VAKKVTKGNKVEKVKQKQFKRVESSVCINCSEQLQCKEYEKYINNKSKKITFGVLCKKG